MSTPTPFEMSGPGPEQKKKKPWYKKWWIWVIVVAFLGVIGISTGGESDNTASESTRPETTAEVANESFRSCQEVAEEGLTQIDDTHPRWNPALDADGNGVGCETSPAPEAESEEETAPVEVEEETQSQVPAPETTEQEVPRENRNALRQAQRYVDMMAFSYQGLYDQLTSEYGGQFPAEAAQYAVDNVDVDWNDEAVESAQSYQDSIGMSDSALYDQLTSEYGGKFTPDQAQYAINNY